MTERIKKKFAELKKQNRAGLVTYTMAYDKDYQTSLDILKNLPKAGADIIELGMPFSDPMADGPTIQEAALRAFAAGAKLKGVLEIVEKFRKEDDKTPIILMGYYNPLYNYGLEKFVVDAKRSGVDGLLIVDLPPEEDSELYKITKSNNIALIKLATPTTDEKRMAVIAKKATGFIYYVAVAGVTGTKSASYASIADAVKLIKKHSNLPVAVGFGIKSKEDVQQVAKYADAVVVGSELIKQILSSYYNLNTISGFVSNLASGLKR